MRKTVLGIFAHPDDAEFLCTGTLSLLKKAGWHVHIATMAPGDKGTTEYSRHEISKIRREEASKSAGLLGGQYHCLEFEDVYIFYGRETINVTTNLLRKIHPDIVFTASPDDYMFDHEITSQIVQTACFSTGIKNMEINSEPFEPIPYLYYCDAMEGKDKFGNLIRPSIYVNVNSEMALKEQMLSCHASQRNWLLKHHKIDEYTLFMKRMAEMRGSEINILNAEGFRQHLGHGYQHDNILKEILGDSVYCNPEIKITADNLYNGK
jgi:LmbE family N-acetylglucosaminyl deacetylase